MKDTTIRLLIQGAMAITSLVGLIVVGAINGDATVMRILEVVLIASVAFFLGHQSGATNGKVAKNGG